MCSSAGGTRSWTVGDRDEATAGGGPVAVKHVRTSIDVDAPAPAVWRLLAEFAHWPAWGPTIRAVDAAADEVAPGVTGRVQTVVGGWLPFEITDVDPGRSWTWRVVGVPATGHAIEPLGGGRSRVEFSVPWPAAPYVVVLRSGLRRLRSVAEQRYGDH